MGGASSQQNKIEKKFNGESTNDFQLLEQNSLPETQLVHQPKGKGEVHVLQSSVSIDENLDKLEEFEQEHQQNYGRYCLNYLKLELQGKRTLDQRQKFEVEDKLYHITRNVPLLMKPNNSTIMRERKQIALSPQVQK